MTTPAHFMGGLASLSVLEQWWGKSLSSRERCRLWLWGLLLSVAIDLDVFIAGGLAGHHKLLTHYPGFWLLVAVFFWGLGTILKHDILSGFGTVTLIASFSHLFLDLFGVTMGIHLLWPFSMREFSLTPLDTSFASEAERVASILQSPTTLFGDTTVIGVGVLVLLQRFWQRRKLMINSQG